MSETRVILSAVLLAAGVAAAVAAVTARMTADPGTGPGRAPGPQIASVRLAELAAEHAERAARGGASAEEIRVSTRAWAAALERTLGDIAERRRVVLLPSRAVAAGAQDITHVVRVMVEERLQRVGFPARVSSARVSGREVRP